MVMGQTQSMTRIMGAGSRRCSMRMYRKHNKHIAIYISATNVREYGISASFIYFSRYLFVFL